MQSQWDAGDERVEGLKNEMVSPCDNESWNLSVAMLERCHHWASCPPNVGISSMISTPREMKPGFHSLTFSISSNSLV